jgi:hypothetical protein
LFSPFIGSGERKEDMARMIRKAKLFYIDRRLGHKFASKEAERIREMEDFEDVQRYGVHLKTGKRGYGDWVTGSGTGLFRERYPLILRQMQIDLTNGKAKKYFCYVFYNF